MFLDSFRIPQIYLAPDAGSGLGADAAPNNEPTQEPAQEPVEQQAQPAQEAAQEPAPAAQEPTGKHTHAFTPIHNLSTDTERAPEQDAKTDQPDAAQQLEAMKAQLGAAQLRSAAALAGVPKARVDYAVRMADVSGIDPTASDAAEKYAAAIDKVLSDVPELRGSAAGTGSLGNFPRKSGFAEDPDAARIEKNILG